MKIYTFILATLLFVGIGKLTAQTSDEEARVIYQMAQEEYDKENYSKAIEYLDKVEKLNEKAKVKTSYLKAKCYEKVNSENANENCLDNIAYYLNNGKDEAKKTELIKLKIKIKNAEENKPKAGLKYFNLKNKVKQIEITTSLDGKELNKEIISFDPSGMITSDKKYNSSGELEREYKYTLNENNYISDIISSDTKDSSYSYESKLAYNSKGNNYEEIRHNLSGKLLSKENREYDKNGYLVSYTLINYKNNTPILILSIVNNENGDAIKISPGGDTFSYEYDEKMNWIKKTCFSTNHILILDRTILYY